MGKALILSVICAGCALAQSVTAVQKGPAIQMGTMAAAIGPVGITTTLAGPMANITGAPYSAQSTTERVQVLADGNRIVQTTSGSVARDTQGRVRREESLPGLTTSDGEAPRIVMIDDPVAHVHWTFDARTKTAMKMPLPNIKFGAPGAMARLDTAPAGNFFFASTTGVAGGAVISSAIPRSIASPVGSDVVKTDLGTQMIEGVAAQGTLITRTIPAGQFGNEQPIVITTETWYSPDLKVLVMSKSSDPRMGDTTYTLTNLQRAEPSASLFQVPDDYTVKDMPGPILQIQKNQ
jgi:hypothetical protein